MTKRIVTLIAIGMLLVFVSVAFSVAWFSNQAAISKAQFGLLQIESTLDMYRALDYNYNGVPEKLSTLKSLGTYSTLTAGTNYYQLANSTDWNQYSVSYYDEEYAFQLIEHKYMLTDQTSSSFFEELLLEDVQPSRIYTFKGVIFNYSGISASMKFSFADGGISVVDSSDTAVSSDIAIDCFEYRLVYVSVDADGNALTTVKSQTAPWSSSDYFGGWKTFSGSEDVFLENLTIGKTKANQKFDFWLQIRMKADSEHSLNDGETLLLPLFVATISIGSTDS